MFGRQFLGSTDDVEGRNKMQNSSKKVCVLYFLLPLMLAAIVLPHIVNISGSLMVHQHDKLSGYPFLKYAPIIPLGAMTPETSGDLKSEYDVVVDVWQQLNSNYGTHVSIYKTAGTYADQSRLRSYLTVTERTHVSSHGVYSSQNGPGIQLASGWLYSAQVDGWSLSSPKSDLLVLSACNSLGYSNHADQSLAQAIVSKSSVAMVVGYRDVVDAYSATYFAHKFWWFMVSAAEPYGGFDGETSFDLAKAALYNHIESIKLVAGLGAPAFLAAIGYLLASLPGGIVGAVLGEIVEIALVNLFVGAWVDLQEQTLNSLDFYWVGSVAELRWTGGGHPGGGDLPQ